MKKILLMLGIVLYSLALGAQDEHFTYYQMTPLLVNPVKTEVFYGSHRNRAVIHDQKPSFPNAHVTPMLYIDAPIIKGFHAWDWIGEGMNFNQDSLGSLKLTKASKVLVLFDETHDFQRLAALGIDLHEGIFHSQVFFQGTLLGTQIEDIRAAGFNYKILIDDMAKWYMSHRDDKEVEFHSNVSCKPAKFEHYITPDHFKLGSLGGYMNYEEMMDNISNMNDAFPDFITKMKAIGNYKTQEKNSLYWTKITSPTKNKKYQVLYTALHHAREPGSMLQLIYFMWYVLENYDKDPMIKALLDHVELYFIPCVNPDGFLYNIAGYPGGLVYWRKNRSIINGFRYGVDLNRNYGYKWGFDDIGSSDDPESLVYRGPAPFSEPETQAVRDFCNQHDFKFALNAHTTSGLLIYPWGYKYELTEDSSIFNKLGNNLTKENDYIHGNSKIIYIVNGDSDDWMYGDSSKPKILSMTPEVGRHGFWSPRIQLIPDCKQMLWMNIGTGLSCLPLANIEANEYPFIMQQEGSMEYEIVNIGIQEGNFKVDILPLSGNIISYSDKHRSYRIKPFSSKKQLLSFEVEPGTPDGDSIVFEVKIYNGYYSQTFHLSSRYVSSNPFFTEDFTDLHRWERSNNAVWGISNKTYTSRPGALADSPMSFYDSSTVGEIYTKANIITVPSGSKGLIWTYKAKWDMPNNGIDIVHPFIIVNGVKFTDLCSKYMTKSLLNDKQTYFGLKNDWVEEKIDLSDFVKPGDRLQLGFEIQTSMYLPLLLDGIYIDDIKLYNISSTHLSTQDSKIRKAWFELLPNPATNKVYIRMNKIPPPGSFWMVKDVLGRMVLKLKEPAIIPVSNWQPGLYIVEMHIKNQIAEVRKLIVHSTD